MRIFEGAQDDGGRQANGKDPPRPTVIFSLQSSPDTSRRTSADLIAEERARWAKRPSKAPSMASVKDLDTFQSWSRETRQFVSITAMHGVKRIWESRGRSKIFWACLWLAMATIMTIQIVELVKNYVANPTVSQVSLELSQNGMKFPKVTICNYNPIKQSYLNSINATGDFSAELVQYLLLANSDPYEILAQNNSNLARLEEELIDYEAAHSSFNVADFFKLGGFSCADMLRRCSFAGREFDCCSLVKPVLTSHGLCQYFNMSLAADAFFLTQTDSSETAGLQIILDVRKDERFQPPAADDPSVLDNPIDAGFRVYVDELELATFSTSQGVSTSPGDVLFTSVSLVTYKDDSDLGSCITAWPVGYNGSNTEMRYQSKDCQSKCKAKFYNSKCGCSPFIYDIDQEYRTCTALEYANCINATLEMPACSDCRPECERFIYGTSNSYGRTFSDQAVSTLAKKFGKKEAYVRDNYLSVSVFFRDLSHTQYSQVAASSLVSLLSNMGGTLGLFLGLSVLTVFESFIYATKVLWMFLSCSRKRYNARKERLARKDRQETTRTVQSIRQLSAKNLEELARRSMRSSDSDSNPSLYSRENSWNNLAEKRDSPPPPFITINLPDP